MNQLENRFVSLRHQHIEGNFYVTLFATETAEKNICTTNVIQPEIYSEWKVMQLQNLCGGLLDLRLQGI